jgi:hypothetical protein
MVHYLGEMPALHALVPIVHHVADLQCPKYSECPLSSKAARFCRIK